MKKTFKFLMCAAVVAGFTACSDSENVNPGGPDNGDGTENGVLTIHFANPSTYADPTDDEKGTAEEQEINSVTILVYNAAGQCKVDTTITKATLDENDASTANNKGVKVNIGVPLGLQRVYAGVNMAPVDPADGVTMESPFTRLHSNVKDSVYYADTLTMERLYTQSFFPMFSEDVKMVTVTKDGPNDVTINVNRLVAKLTVKKGGSFSGSYDDVAGAKFDTDNLTWDVGNVNTKVFPYAKAVSDNMEDPNYAGPASLAVVKGVACPYVTENFVNSFNTLAFNYEKWEGFSDKVGASDDAAEPLAVNYTPENNSAKRRAAESSYVVVKAKFAPNKIYKYDGTPETLAEDATQTSDINGNTTYYVVRANGTYYFTDEGQAKAYCKSLNIKGLSVEKFIGQYCFYPIFMGDQSGSKIRKTDRNTYYAITINGFTDLGYPHGEIDGGGDEGDYPDGGDPNDVDPNGTNDGVGRLDVTVLVNNWVVLDEDHPLGHE